MRPGRFLLSHFRSERGAGFQWFACDLAVDQRTDNPHDAGMRSAHLAKDLLETTDLGDGMFHHAIMGQMDIERFLFGRQGMVASRFERQKEKIR